MGALQMVGGAVEAIVGGVGGVVTSETGVGAVLGYAVAMNGIDNATAGAIQLWTGESQNTLLHKGVSATAVYAGASYDTAERVATYADISTIALGGFSSYKGFSSWGKGTGLSDDAFVHVTTPGGAKNIQLKGLDPEISGFVTKWKYVKNVSNGSDFNTMLYSQKLWPQTAGKFDNGFNILHINSKPTFFSPRTNWVNGIPQYKYNSFVDPSLINIVK